MAMLVDLDLLRQNLPEDLGSCVNAIDNSLPRLLETYNALGTGSESEKKERKENLSGVREHVAYSEYAVSAADRLVALRTENADAVANDRLGFLSGNLKAVAKKTMSELETALLALSKTEFASPHTLELLETKYKAGYERIREDTKAGVIKYLSK